MNSRDIILNRLYRSAPLSYESRAVILKSEAEPGDAGLFAQNAEKAGARVVRVADLKEALEALGDILTPGNGSIAVADDEAARLIDLAAWAEEMGLKLLKSGDIKDFRDNILKASVGISGCDAALAETGSVVICHKKGRERLLSLAPQHHVCIVLASQIIKDRYGLPGLLAAAEDTAACTIITGVSRTADVAMQVVLGMHGPKRMDIILVDNCTNGVRPHLCSWV